MPICAALLESQMCDERLGLSRGILVVWTMKIQHDVCASLGKCWVGGCVALVIAHTDVLPRAVLVVYQHRSKIFMTDMLGPPPGFQI